MKVETLSKKLGFDIVAFLLRWHERLTGSHVTNGDTHDHVGGDGTQIDHDTAANFDADEHVAHEGVSMMAGSGLTGGGNIGTTRTFNVNLEPYQVTDNAGNQAIDGTERTLNLDTEHIADANYSLSGDHVTIVDAGTYLISYGLLWDTTNTSGGATHVVEAHCEKITAGPTYTNIAPSYSRQVGLEQGAGVPTGYCGKPFLFTFAAGEGIRVRMDRVAGTTNIDTSQYGSSLSIVKVSN